MERRPLPHVGPKGKFRNWIWRKWYKCRQWWTDPRTGLQIGCSIGMLGKSQEQPYLTYIKLLCPLPWRYAAKLPLQPRTIMADTDAVLESEAQTHELRQVNVWKWHDTPMRPFFRLYTFFCTGLGPSIQYECEYFWYRTRSDFNLGILASWKIPPVLHSRTSHMFARNGPEMHRLSMGNTRDELTLHRLTKFSSPTESFKRRNILAVAGNVYSA
ncbi:hypothetical protein KVR01_007206 [Diaporthe batatas]|uniref:uncharacterized protein n=1 Tax=Diaporthe batatas TaxID=748121 RepID=UPI001D03C2B3|nr:uncharacterized protein KVR01_007206 [Diaporthe batatas]KAG8162728.1 hypothetical protein KVR01_007206 [Diaporthe batatas]